MLIHKQTMGVLDQYWSGLYVSVGQERVPQMIEYTLANTGLSPADWWEIPRLSRRPRLSSMSSSQRRRKNAAGSAGAADYLPTY